MPRIRCFSGAVALAWMPQRHIGSAAEAGVEVGGFVEAGGRNRGYVEWEVTVGNSEWRRTV